MSSDIDRLDVPMETILAGLPKQSAYKWAGPKWEDASDAQKQQLGQIQERLCAHLTGKRRLHSLSVARCAQRLACRHGVDPFLATAAGLLHDWDKRLTREELFDKARRYGIKLACDDEKIAPTLHGMTAARSLPEEFDLPACVFQAIDRHTVGHPHMSDLDMVVYCADMLEPLRGDRMEALRAYADGPLDVLFCVCQAQSLAYLIRSGKFVYPQAIDVWNAYVDRLPKDFLA